MENSISGRNSARSLLGKFLAQEFPSKWAISIHEGKLSRLRGKLIRIKWHWKHNEGIESRTSAGENSFAREIPLGTHVQNFFNRRQTAFQVEEIPSTQPLLKKVNKAIKTYLSLHGWKGLEFSVCPWRSYYLLLLKLWTIPSIYYFSFIFRRSRINKDFRHFVIHNSNMSMFYSGRASSLAISFVQLFAGDNDVALAGDARNRSFVH